MTLSVGWHGRRTVSPERLAGVGRAGDMELEAWLLVSISFAANKLGGPGQTLPLSLLAFLYKIQDWKLYSPSPFSLCRFACF